MSDELDQVRQMIDERSHDSRTRIHVVAEMLRDLLAADDKGEVMLAFTMVMAEGVADEPEPGRVFSDAESEHHARRLVNTSPLQGFVCVCGARILYGRRHLNCPGPKGKA